MKLIPEGCVDLSKVPTRLLKDVPDVERVGLHGDDPVGRRVTLVDRPEAKDANVIEDLVDGSRAHHQPLSIGLIDAAGCEEHVGAR